MRWGVGGAGQDITIYGDGTQTRSFQHVHDLVSGLISLMESDYTMPVNIGNPDEHTILDVRMPHCRTMK